MSERNFLGPRQLAWLLEKIIEENGDDVEVCHVKLDDALCRQLEKMGYEAAIKIYREANKWHS